MKNLWLSLILVVVLASCHKEKDPEYVYLSSYTKDHFYFKKGSYWIYKDSVSGRVDSFYLKNSVINWSEGEWTNIIGEILKLEIIQINSDTNKKDLTQWFYTITDKSLTVSYKTNNNEVWVARGNIYSLHDAFVPYPPGHTRFYSGKIGNLQVKTILFPNVWTVLFEDSLATSKSIYYKTQHFYNDSVGFPKISIRYNDNITSINEVWELQQWKLIK